MRERGALPKEEGDVQAEDPNEDISIALKIGNNYLPPCSSRTFWKQSH